MIHKKTGKISSRGHVRFVMVQLLSPQTSRVAGTGALCKWWSRRHCGCFPSRTCTPASRGSRTQPEPAAPSCSAAPPTAKSRRRPGCSNISDAALEAVASGCKQLTSLHLEGCDITDAAVQAVASACKQLTALHLGGCDISDAAVEAVEAACPQLAVHLFD